jgi:hypothetical protein
MDVGPGQFQALCARATDLENTVAELGREAMAAAVITFAEACSDAVCVADGLRRRRPRSARPGPRRLRAVGCAR